MRKFKLLKDLPYVKAGMLYEWSSFEERYISGEIPVMKNDYLQKEIVENNPEWFEEIFTVPLQTIMESDGYGIFNKLKNRRIDENPPCILIDNPTEQTRELLKGKVVERWVNNQRYNQLIKGGEIDGACLQLWYGGDFTNKILIVIPEEKT